MSSQDSQFSSSAAALDVGASGGVPEGLSLEQAMDMLRQAAAQKKVDPICAAYLTLRRAAKGMKLAELFALADQALDAPSQILIVSAFSHQRCYMCSDGTVACPTCGGTGLAEPGRRCTKCDGLPVPCGLCRGTNWSGPEGVPAELSRAVRGRQWVRVRAEVERLDATLQRDLAQYIFRLGFPGRQTLAAWLMRLQARLGDLAAAGAIPQAEQEQAQRAGQLIDQLIEELQRAPLPEVKDDKARKKKPQPTG